MDVSKNYRTYRWTKLRAAIIRRDHNECQWCKRRFKVTPAEVVHHIIPAEKRPDLFFEPTNLVSLCRDCHEEHHGRGAGAFGRSRRQLEEAERFPERW